MPHRCTVLALAWLALTLIADAQSSRPGWGALPYADAGGTGVTFRVWAPNATSVYVAGTFNSWSGTAHPLVLESTNTGVWSRDVATARTNHNYKYVINGTLWRSDPRSRSINAADNHNSIITSTGTFAWAGGDYQITNAHDLVLYEAHVGTLVGPGGTFTSFTNRLGYLQDLGISALELMPINEFPSATSWGYNPAYPFAIESSYGSPDSLKALVQGARQRGLVTMIDVVHNHWDGDSSLWQFDTTLSPGPYFYPTDPYANTWWGPRPDYRRPEVRACINDTFRMWLDEFHISGFRWDAPRHSIYTTNNVYIPDGMLMITNALALMAAAYPGTWNIAEDTKEISGFNHYWDFTFSSEIRSVLTQSDDSARDMTTVARNLNGITARIIYTDSHDTAGDLNGGSRLPTAIHSSDPAGYYARKRSALGAALVMTAPGTPMILQGQELLETNQFSDTRGVDWARTNSQAGTLRLYRDLIRLRRNLDGVSAGLLGDTISTYLVDNTSKLVAYSRFSSTETGAPVVVVANFANTTRTGFTVRFPAEGTWYTLFNSDSTNYAPDYGNAGSAEINAAGNPPQAAITVAPYSVLILSQTPRSGLLVQDQQHLDQPLGNQNGLLDPGEQIQARLVLWNKSQIPAAHVSAQLISDTPGVTVVQGQSTYPAMPADGLATNDLLFTYALSPTQPCGSRISLRLVTTFNDRTVTNALEQPVGAVVHIPAVTNLFVSTDTPLLIPDTSTVYSVLNLAEAGDPVLTRVRVRVRINHSYDRDVTLALQHPDGTEVMLVRRRGGSADNFGTGTGTCGQLVYTVFDQDAATAISSGTAPFAGTYRPEASLATLNGKSVNGAWRLRMRDETTQDTGTNLCWGLELAYESTYAACQAFSNRPPVVNPTNLFLVWNSPTNFALEGADPDGQPVTYLAQADAQHGLFTLLSTTGGWARYTPVHGYQGTDAVLVAATDGLVTGLPALVSFVVAPTDADTNGLPDAWEYAYFTNTVAGDEDPDGDGQDNRAEYFAHTHPRDSNSVLRLLAMEGPGLAWPSVGGSRYTIERADALEEGSGFSPLARPLAEELDPAPYGQSSTQYFTDATGSEPMQFYRVRVRNE